MNIPHDYLERVYAGVLGKIIGVYLGRPFESWTHDRIMAELGEINYYVHERRGVPLVVTDDDISGTFTFLRALPDHGNDAALTPAQIGNTWLNYIIENRTILWWGGLGNSTEHTAYLRLKSGIEAPRSGSMALNGKVVAEQIGSQIFIDGWAMVSPGDPEQAADLARRAASVSHDGEAIYGAQVVAAMEAAAFVESDINKLIDCALQFIPHDSTIYRLIDDIRQWHAQEQAWTQTRRRIEERYGYDTYGGNCHMVPNHALIIHALLYGEDDFQKTLMIANTCGWDTDCNSGNVGCLMGIKNGLAAIDAGPDWRGPVADRLYLSTADGGRAITDAVAETYEIVNIGRALAGQEPVAPKNGARFHFELPGAVQGFQPEPTEEVKGTVRIENVSGHSETGSRSLALHYRGLAPGRVARVATPTFIPAEAVDMKGYELIASPTLYPGQQVRAAVAADANNSAPILCRLYLRVYGAGDELVRLYGPEQTLAAGARHDFTWRIAPTGGEPIAEIGVELRGEKASGAVYLDYLTWDGEPDMVLTRPEQKSTLWRRAWVNAVDHFDRWWPEPFRLVQDHGRGVLIQGTRDWRNYQVTATMTPHMVASFGIALRAQGLERYYALLLRDQNQVQLIERVNGDTVLAECDFPWQFGQAYALRLAMHDQRLWAWIDDQLLFDVAVTTRTLDGGGVALICEEGRVAADAVRVEPTSSLTLPS